MIDDLVDLKTYCPKVVIALSRGKEEKALLKKSVADRLNVAADLLPEGVRFIIKAAYRTEAIQKEIYEDYYNKFKMANPSWSDSRVKEETDKFVAPYSGLHKSAHMLGNAIDVRLIKNGKRLPMVSKKLSFAENALTKQTKLPKYIRKNRKIMFDALLQAGFKNLPNEYWHWFYKGRLRI